MATMGVGLARKDTGALAWQLLGVGALAAGPVTQLRPGHLDAQGLCINGSF